MTITALPTPPTRQDPTNFAARGDAFLAALPTFQIEANETADFVNDRATIAQTSAASSQVNAFLALESAAQSQAFSQAAAVSANVTRWQSGTSYLQGQTVFSVIDFHTYRARVAFTSSVDPFTDTTNWQKLTGVDTVDYGFINTTATTFVDYGALT